jgi:hypothetical protein
MAQEKEAPTTLEEAMDIAKALEPLGYEVYGVEDTWYSGKVQGLVVKVIRVEVPEKTITREEFESLPPEQRDNFQRPL